MPDLMPAVAISELSPGRVLQARDSADYDLSVRQPGRRLPDFPGRAAFYAVGLCQAGTVELPANRARHHIGPGSRVGPRRPPGPHGWGRKQDRSRRQSDHAGPQARPGLCGVPPAATPGPYQRNFS